ncbi:isoprenylcysteine carboxylmethyltransferase family protein [Ammonicoccus fulvus]|uniref:Isoprenylcysteine carboxylmethyltransferase family protein n=1 Tax=Ammonicoccus fulvus TaxID=3138240 RepID=A0ABZ3FNT9_9ACTN
MTAPNTRWWELKVPPVALFAIAGIAQRLLTRRRPLTPGRLMGTGATALAAGGLGGAAVLGFGRSGTTVNPHTPERTVTLVTEGAHALSRNPMYVALAGGLLTHAVWLGSMRALIPAAGFMAVVDALQIRPEERLLTERFGEAYADYRRRVPRWLGPLRS